MACAVLVDPALSLAFENMGVINGSFRNLFPVAIVKHHSAVHIASNTASRQHRHLYLEFNDEAGRTKEEFAKIAADACKEKSDYAIADHYVLNSAFHPNGALLFTATADIVCFDLPSPKKVK